MKNEKIEIVEVPIGSISPSPWNSNEMSDPVFAGLKKTMRKHGLHGAILVRELEDGKYEIIDGEHRWKAAKDAGDKKIAVTVLDRDEYDAIIQMLNMNKIRGTMSTLKMAAVVSSLLDSSDIATVTDNLALSQEEINGLLEAKKEAEKIKKDKNEEKEKTDAGEALTKDREPSVTFSIKVTVAEYERILTALAEMGGSSDIENVMLICDKIVELDGKG